MLWTIDLSGIWWFQRRLPLLRITFIPLHISIFQWGRLPATKECWWIWILLLFLILSYLWNINFSRNYNVGDFVTSSRQVKWNFLCWAYSTHVPTMSFECVDGISLSSADNLMKPRIRVSGKLLRLGHSNCTRWQPISSPFHLNRIWVTDKVSAARPLQRNIVNEHEHERQLDKCCLH